MAGLAFRADSVIFRVSVDEPGKSRLNLWPSAHCDNPVAGIERPPGCHRPVADRLLDLLLAPRVFSQGDSCSESPANLSYREITTAGARTS